MSETPDADPLADLSRFYENRDLIRDDELPDTTADIGSRITQAREAAGMTQQELAEHIGVRQEAVRRWERGSTSPRANRLDTIAGLLGVSISWLMIGRGDAPSQGADLDGIRDDLVAVRHALQQVLRDVDSLAVRLGGLEASE